MYYNLLILVPPNLSKLVMYTLEIAFNSFAGLENGTSSGSFHNNAGISGLSSGGGDNDRSKPGVGKNENNIGVSFASSDARPPPPPHTSLLHMAGEYNTFMQ